MGYEINDSIFKPFSTKIRGNTLFISKSKKFSCLLIFVKLGNFSPRNWEKNVYINKNIVYHRMVKIIYKHFVRKLDQQGKLILNKNEKCHQY